MPYVLTADETKLLDRYNRQRLKHNKVQAEYRKRLKANDPDYNVWVAKTGEADIKTGVKMVKDVSSGTLFTSTNNSAWTAYQSENMKYEIEKVEEKHGLKFYTVNGRERMKNELLKVA